MVGHPRELDTHSRKEGSKQQREHGSGHNPMEHAGHLRMPGHTFWYIGGGWGPNFRGKLSRLGKVPKIGGMNYEERQASYHGHPDQEPSNVNWNFQPPRIYSPF